MDKKVRVKVVISDNGKETYIYPNPNENLLDALIRSDFLVAGDCNGRGTCGSCRVKVIEGFLDITLSDKKLLSDDQLMQGYRLACMAHPDGECTIILENNTNKDYKALTRGLSLGHHKLPDKDFLSGKAEKGYGIAIDLGTTTLALVLTDMPKGDIIKRYTATNPQKVYGVDVISRIKASNEGKGQALKSLIRKELIQGINYLITVGQADFKDIKKIVISGNTTMIHLLMGYPCDCLGKYPFTPYKQGFIISDSDEIFEISEKIPVIILPALSVFVGGDITAGLLACGFDINEKPCLFIDLGTNGELALGNKERILVTSVSAGPAFEGGNISCGVGSIPGAICHVSITDSRISYQTIGGMPPVGICGTGIIELTSQLLKEGIIDRTGLLADEYFDDGFNIDGLKFKQEDIRNLQLAKAAVRAGIEILLKNYGISCEDLDRVYFAGGFGYFLDTKKAADIGLIPSALTKKAVPAGNTALSGAVLASMDAKANKRLEHIIAVSKEIHLSEDNVFNDLFIKYISF